MAVYPSSATFRDCRGDAYTLRWYVSADNPADAESFASSVLLPVFSASNALLVATNGAVVGAVAPEEGYGITDPYSVNSWRVQFSFVRALGGSYHLSIPAPGDWVMFADGVTPAVGNWPLSALVDAVLAYACTRDGEAIAAYRSSRLLWSPRKTTQGKLR